MKRIVLAVVMVFVWGSLAWANPDVLHSDDVIITGSLCVGFDCVNGESFGFDTIKLKEHNLRIKFQDTSYTASYPTNDWQITVNDSTNGGANKFSIDDIDGGRTPFTIEAGAPSHSLYVEDYGRVGLGTSTPSVELHIVDGDTPTVRLDQDGSSGWTAQRWDVAGNETNFFIRDVTNGSKLPFRIQPNTPSNTLALKSSGYVGLGTWTPATGLHIEGTSLGSVIRLDNTTATTGREWELQSGNTGLFRILDRTATAARLSIDEDGNVGIGTTSPGGLLDVNGEIYQRGSLLHADYVFKPDYQLESIEKHAEFMWKNKHLKAVPKVKGDDQGKEIIAIGAHRRGIVEELEKAHIYIEQLHKHIKTLEGRLAKLEERINERQ